MEFGETFIPRIGRTLVFQRNGFCTLKPEQEFDLKTHLDSSHTPLTAMQTLGEIFQTTDVGFWPYPMPDKPGTLAFHHRLMERRLSLALREIGINAEISDVARRWFWLERHTSFQNRFEAFLTVMLESVR